MTHLGRAWRGHARLLGLLAAATVALATLLAGLATTRGDAAPSRPETVARGSFTGLVHSTVGSAKIVELGNGDRRLVMAGFETRAAPELFVYLVPGSSYGDRMGSAVKLGRLKYIEGGQAYDIPSSFQATGPSTVIIWCGRCSNAFGRAQLRSL
ncbi:MAG: DM13 domain-containing protein [Actinobacteria bacterium]|nr:DM13 domain-containing protein [Actinomycetota bacterium]